MNKPTYRAIAAAKTRLEAMRAEIALMLELDEIDGTKPLAMLEDHASNDWEDHTEEWQEGDNGQEERERIDALGNVVTELEQVRSALDSAIDLVETIEGLAPEGAFKA